MTEVVAVCMCKNEVDILPHIIDHLYEEDISHFYIVDNGSTDGTLEYLFEMHDHNTNFVVDHDQDPAYYQASKMNRFVREAAEYYGDEIIILPFDSDEMFYSKNSTFSLGDALRLADVHVATVLDHVPHPSDNITRNPLIDMQHRMPYVKSPPSVAFKYHPDAVLAMGNHSVGYPDPHVLSTELIGVRHFQYRSEEQYKRKLRNGKKAYDATDLPEMYGAHWREGGAKSDEVLHNEWMAYIAQPTVYDPAPVKGKI